jgi:hypothetical protein
LVEREIESQLAALAQSTGDSGQNISAASTGLLSRADRRAITERVIHSIDIQQQALADANQTSLTAASYAPDQALRTAVSAELSLRLAEHTTIPSSVAEASQSHSSQTSTTDWQAEGRIVIHRLGELVRENSPEQAWGSAAVYFRELVKGKARDEEMASICEGLAKPRHHQVSYRGMRAGFPGGFMMAAGATVAVAAGVGLAAALGAASLGVIPIVALGAVTLIGTGFAIAGLVRFAKNRYQQTSLKQLESAARGDERAIKALARRKPYIGLNSTDLRKRIKHEAMRTSLSYALETLHQRLQQRMFRTDPYNISLSPVSIALLPHVHPLDLQRIAKLDAKQGPIALAEVLGLNLSQV